MTNLNNDNEQNKKRTYKPVSSITLDTRQLNNLSKLMTIHQNSVGISQTKFLEHIARKVIEGDYVGVVKPKPNKKRRISFNKELLDEMKEIAKEMGYERKIAELLDDIIRYEYAKQNRLGGRMSEEQMLQRRRDFKKIGVNKDEESNVSEQTKTDTTDESNQ